MSHKIKEKQNPIIGNRSRSSNITQTSSSCFQNRNKKENEIRAKRTDAKNSSKKYRNSYANSKLDHKTVLNNSIVKNKSRTTLKRHSNDTYGEPNCKYKKKESSVIESPKKYTAELRIQNIRKSFEKPVQNEALNAVEHHDISHKRYSANTRLEKLRKSLIEKVNNETITSNITSNYNNTRFTEDCDVEMMDWETIPEQQIIDNIIKVRSTVFDSNTEIWASLKCNSGVPSTINSFSLCIVIDTNIFISHLEFIQHLTGAQFGDKGRPLLVVPWIVLQELDIIKDRRCSTNIQQLQQSARQAVNFLNEWFIKNDSHIIGQTPIDASNELFNCKSPDDRILNCCLQFSRDNNFVVLLSNDKNLRNKALVSNIPAYNRDEIISKLHIESGNVVHNPPIRRTISSFGSMKDVTCKYWTTILETEMKRAYGDIWLRIVYKKPPWNIVNVLACFTKHWIAVFSLIWPSSVRSKLEELNKFLQMSGIELRGPDTETLQNLLIDICSIIGQSCPEYERDMTKCIKEIETTINL